MLATTLGTVLALQLPLRSQISQKKPEALSCSSFTPLTEHFIILFLPTTFPPQPSTLYCKCCLEGPMGHPPNGGRRWADTVLASLRRFMLLALLLFKSLAFPLVPHLDTDDAHLLT